MPPFDPIRDSAASAAAAPSSASSGHVASPTIPRTSSSSSIGAADAADEDGFDEGHYRRPSRSASIMSILNPTPSSPQRPSSSASQQHPASSPRPSRMSIHGLVTPTSPHQPTPPPPMGRGQTSRSPSLPIANVLNPSPMPIPRSSRPSWGNQPPPQSYDGPSASSSTEFYQRPPLQIDPRSPPVPVSAPHFATRFATSPTEAGPPPPQQYFESPTGGTVVPLASHYPTHPNLDRPPRGPDGFRVPSLPSHHRSPDLVRAPLPPLTPGAGTGPAYPSAYPSAATTPGGYGSAQPSEFFPPTTPGAGGSFSYHRAPSASAPMTPSVPLTPGGSVGGGESRDSFYPPQPQGEVAPSSRRREEASPSAVGAVIKEERAEEAQPEPAKKKAKRSSISAKGAAPSEKESEAARVKTESPTTGRRRSSKPKIDPVFPGTVVEPGPASSSSSNNEAASAAPTKATPGPSPSPATGSGRKVKALDEEEMEQLANRDGAKKRKSSTSMASNDQGGIAAESSSAAAATKKPRISLPPKPTTAPVKEESEQEDVKPPRAGFNGAAAAREEAPPPSASVASTLASPASAAPLPSPSSSSSSSAIPYKPTQRVSRPDGVLRPLSRDELVHLHGVIEARGANRLRDIWRREQSEKNGDKEARDGFWDVVVPQWGQSTTASGSNGNGEAARGDDGYTGSQAQAHIKKDENNDDEDAPAPSSEEVARHYNNRQEQGLAARDLSPIAALKKYNNWVKSILIGSYGTRHGRAMDLGGGKGGDLQKWDKLGIRELVLADIAATSVEQAKARHREKKNRFHASFFALDCFGESLADKLPQEVLREPFDTVSLQFCMHYGWSSPQRARLVVENAARWLRSGGFFIGTIPDQNELYRRLDSLPPSELTFGNTKYHVSFEQRARRKPFGDRYTFFLADAVDEVPEYVVDWTQFVSLAEEYGLELVFRETMADMWDKFRSDPQFGDLARRMKVTTRPWMERGGKPEEMDWELWEATTVYQAFAFRKR